MTRSRNSTRDSPAPPTADRLDPAALAERDDVDNAERVYPHRDADHCEGEADGRVVVGLTNADDEVLVLLDPGREHAILPNCTVDPGEEWTAVARETVEAVANAPVEIGDPVAVRRVEHYTVGDEVDPADEVDAAAVADREPHNVTHHVVFEAAPASPQGDGDTATDVAPSVDDDTDWEAGWYRSLPGTVDVDDADPSGDVLDDIRRFLP